MHPLLTRISRLGLYLLAWIPLAVLLIFLLVASGRLAWGEAAAVVLPLCLIYAFMCLSAWYSCRNNPLNRTGIGRLLLAHMAAAALVSGLWVAAARAISLVLERTSSFRGLDERFSAELPVLFAAGILLYLLSVAFHYVLLAMEESRQAEARALEASVLAREAELRALKAQVNPHFLFNSLNSISALTSANPGKAREMCILLADFLRMTLGLGAKSSIPLAEEVSLLERFLGIEKVRFGPRLVMEEEIEDKSKAALVPPLLLQPLVENAVTHGIANLPGGGKIRLAARCENGRLCIELENACDPEAPPARRGGMGIENVRKRLEARYGSEASLTVAAQSDRFRVGITLPAETQEKTP